MAKNLEFYWRMGDFALEACDEHLTQLDPKTTIELVKYFRSQGREMKYTIGYFVYNTREPCWELRFTGDRFKEVREADLAKLFEMLACAYDALERWCEEDEE